MNANPNPVSASHSPVDVPNGPGHGFSEGMPGFGFGPAQQPTDLSNLPKDKIPKKPLQKKGMKKKALTGGPISLPTGSPSSMRMNLNTVPGHLPNNNTNHVPTLQQQVPPVSFAAANSTIPAQGASAGITTAPPSAIHPGLKEAKLESSNNPFADFTSPILRHPHEWSERLKREGMEPSADLKIYESIITKDLDYLKEASAVMNAAKENENKVNDKVGVNGKLFNRILKDLKFYQQVKAARMQSMKLPPEVNGLTSKMWGEGYSGYGNGFTNGKIEFVFPENSKMRYTDENLNEDSENLHQDGEHIPIRLEFDVDRDGFKLNDTFIWNSNEDEETLKVFVNELVKDYRIENNVSNVKQKILASIKEQIADLHPMVVNPNIDLRFPINLDITISNNQLVDRFDWDLMNQENSPEEFADTLCDEFALPNEFRTAIAHCIREQCQIYLKSLYMIGYKFDGGAIVSEDLKEFLRSGFDQNNVMMPRYLLSDFTPSVQELSIDNFERIIKERERESKRKKKGTSRVGRRGGFVLPDLSNMPKTFRTPLPTAIFPGGVSVIGHDHDTSSGNGNNGNSMSISAADAVADDYTDVPIEIEVPAQQLRRVHEKEVEEKKALELLRCEQQATRTWLSRLRERRLRGETLTATAQLVESPSVPSSSATTVKQEDATDVTNGSLQASKSLPPPPLSDDGDGKKTDELVVRLRFGWR